MNKMPLSIIKSIRIKNVARLGITRNNRCHQIPYYNNNSFKNTNT